MNGAILVFCMLCLQAQPDGPPPALSLGVAPHLHAQRTAVPDAWLGADKFQHVGSAYAVTAAAFAAASTAGIGRRGALAAAVGTAAAAGIGKELHDRSTHGHFSVRDLIADAVGTAAAFFLLREVR